MHCLIGQAPQADGPYISPTYYHEAGTTDASSELAYILQHAAGDQGALQVAVWGAIGHIPDSRPWMTNNIRSKGEALLNEAKSANSFVNGLVGGALTIEDKTDYKNKFKISVDGDKVIAGPYVIEYNTGNYGEKDFCEVSDKYMIYDNGTGKIEDVEVIGSISSGNPFYVKYDPHVGNELITYAKLGLEFRYLQTTTKAKITRYEGNKLIATYSGDLTRETDEGNTEYQKVITKDSAEAQALAKLKIVTEEKWNTQTAETKEPEHNTIFDLSLKKFISKVGENTINPERVTVIDAARLYKKTSDNAMYNKIYTPYKIGNIDNFEYTIRIYNEGDIEGKATKIQDKLPEGVTYEIIDSAGYNISYDESTRTITFEVTDSVKELQPFTGGEMDYLDIKIKCTIDDSVYNDKTSEQKVYDLSMNQYIETEGNKTKEVKTGDDVIYTLKVTNNGDESVYLKEIKQTLPAGIEFNDDSSIWSVLTNSDGTSEVSRIICENVAKESSILYEIKCKITAKEGILKTTSEIISIAEPDIDESDWKDYAKIIVKNEEQDYSDLKLEQKIVEINGAGKDSQEEYGVIKGAVVKYKITLTNEGENKAEDIKIADYISDGMKFIPPEDDSEYDELNQIAGEDLKTKSDENQKWNANENKNTVEYNEAILLNKGDTKDIYLYCVVTTDEKIDLKNIVEIISFADNKNNIDIDSTPDNVKLNEYLYEKQEDDDACTIISTRSSNDISDLSISTGEDSDNDVKNGDLVNYNIEVKNSGTKDVQITIKDILNGLKYVGNSGTYDEANRIIEFENVIITAGQSKTIEVKCEITEKNAELQLFSNETMSEEEKSQYNKTISHTTYIEKADIYDKTRSDWKAKQNIGTLKTQTKEFENQGNNPIEEYVKYLTNTAMIIETSKTDRDTNDWKDSETIVIEENSLDSIKVKKVWKDNNNANGKRTESIIVKLLEDGLENRTIELSDSNNWQYSFTNLEPNKVYTIEEENVDNYETEIVKNGNVYTITNYYDDSGDSTEVTVKKVWEDNNNKYGLRPNSVTVKLLNEDGTTCRKAELNESNNWKHTFKGLDQNIIYTVDEETVKYYSKSINGYTITNSYNEISTPTPPPPPPTPTTPTLPPGVPITMEIAGNVFEDLPSTKGGETDNKRGVEDGYFAGIEVALYEDDEVTLAKLYQQYEENPNISKSESEIRTNPTITDEYGSYSFKGLDPTKKYKVKFVYNGLAYEPVQCNDSKDIYNTPEWEVTSKATDDTNQRKALNQKFSEIKSYPNNYDGNKKVYLQTDLENEKIYDGENIYTLIANEIRTKIAETRAYPDTESIYHEISGKFESIDSEIMDKLQFIEDCKINAWTNEKYPIYNNFVMDNEAMSVNASIDNTVRYTIDIENNTSKPYITTDYEEINTELERIVNIIYNRGIFIDFKYDIDFYFPIETRTVSDSEAVFSGYSVGVYKYEVKLVNNSGKIVVEPKLEDIKNNLAWSLNVANGIDTGNVKYKQNVDQIFEIFDNHKSEIEKIIGEIVKKIQKYYDENYKVIIIEPGSSGFETIDQTNIYPGQLHINLGLRKREEFDLTIAKDVYKVDLKINDNTMTYKYNDVDTDTYTGDWVAEVRASDTFYERNIYASDYNYYKENASKKLEVEVTYRIALRNQTSQIIGEVTEIVDYFDSEYSYKSGSTFLGDGKENKIVDLTCSTDSKYGNKSYPNLNSAYISNGEEGIKIKNGEDKFIYITFKVNDPDGILSDGKINPNGIKELEKSKQNIVEINGYKTYYAGNSISYNGENKSNGTVVGVLDIDSIPGNYVPSDHYDDNKRKYIADEDDVGIANGLYILIDYYNQRTITGTVWEDSPDRTLLAQKIRQGDGSYTEGEKLIQNIKTSLKNVDGVAKYYDIELDEWLPAEIYTDENGKYSLVGFVPGEYEVWFTYDNNSINTKIDGTTYTETRYNGQDFKSTIYDSDLYKVTNADGTITDTYDKYWYTKTDNSKSDAIDIWQRRMDVNNYSTTLTNNIAEKLIPSDLDNYSVSETTMYAKTNKMELDVEYTKNTLQSLTRTEEEKQDGTDGTIKKLVKKDDYSKYVIQNVDFGLVERPRAQLSIQKNVANVKVLLADGTVLFDAIPDTDGKFKATNLGSIARKLATAYVETTYKTDGTIDKLKNSTHVSTEQGRITMNMDEELMQGANLQVTYEISVENIGEIDYNNEEFYNKGYELTYKADGTIDTYNLSNSNNLVTTKVDQIIDYVENNMQFANKLGNKDINKNWTVKKQDEIDPVDELKVILKEEVIKGLFNDKTTELDDAYNTIAVLTGDTDAKDGSTISISAALNPGKTGKSDFILTQLISPENENDDLTYKNILEIVKTTNTVGRRMYFSIAGNHVPVKRETDGKIKETAVRPEGMEIDTDDGELITIIPPFGANKEQPTQIAIFAIGLIAFLGTGIYLIKKKVLK